MNPKILYPGHKPWLLAALVLLSSLLHGQQLNLSLTSVSGTYTANTGGTTLIGSGVDESYSGAQNIGFTFTLGCNTYTQFKASSNGWMSLGTSATGAMYPNDLATVNQGPLLAPLWDDLATSGAGAGNVNYVLTGSAPNRVLTVEWLRMAWDYTNAQASVSFQVKLYETSNIIEYVYRQETNAPVAASASVGLNGGSLATDFYSLDGTGAAPNAVYGTQTSTLNTRPANGQVYRFTPQSQTFVSCTTVQATLSTASKCEDDHAIIGVQVVVSGCLNPLSLTQIKLNMVGTTVPGPGTSDVTNIHIYYTGNSPVFSTSNELQAGGTVPVGGTITITGSQTLVSGTNYFWVAYDLNAATATIGDNIDAGCSQITVGAARIPTVTAPAGHRVIAACSVAPGSTKSNLAFWVKANAGTSTTINGASLSTWNDQSGNARHATSPGAANSPTYYDNSTNHINFNPVVDFDDASQVAANADLMNIAANGVLSSGNNPYSVYAVIKPGPNNLSAPGKFLFSGTFNGAGNTFNSFDIRSGNAFNDSWDINDLKINSLWTVGYPSLATFDFNSTRREMFVSGASAGTKTGNYRFSPDQNDVLGCQAAVVPNIEFYDGSMAEIITYTNTSHSAVTRNKIESYLGIKYGVTLMHNYLSSAGNTVWNRSQDAAYNTNIIGIARDDNSLLSQKQSKSTSVTQDMLTLYIGPSKLANQAGNGGSFTSGDQSFFMAANNADPYLFSGTPTELPPGICCRVRREWLSQTTNFTNTDLKLEFDFNVIAPGYAPLLQPDLRLLVDDDGNFTNATVLGSPSVTITVASSVVTVLVPASAFSGTPYFTLGSVSISTILPVQFTSFTALCQKNSALLSWTAAAEMNNDAFSIERSADGIHFMPLATVKSKQAVTPSSYTWTDETRGPGPSYYRVKSTSLDGHTVYSSVAALAACELDELRLVANPATAETALLLQLKQDAMVDISLFDATGRRFEQAGLTGRQFMKAGAGRLPVRQEGLARGVYFLHVTVNGNSTVFRLFN